MRILFYLLLLLVAPATQAAYTCKVSLSNDITITPQQVNVIGSSGNLLITQQGEITYNSKALVISDVVRQQAKAYQATLRRDLPAIYQQSLQHYQSAMQSVDRLLVTSLGEQSQTRVRLTQLQRQLQPLLHQLVEVKEGRFAFNALQFDSVKKQGIDLVETTLGGMIQDSINEVGSRPVKPNQAIDDLFNQLAGLQKTLKQEFDRQEQVLKPFVQTSCAKLTALERMRQDLLREIRTE